MGKASWMAGPSPKRSTREVECPGRGLQVTRPCLLSYPLSSVLPTSSPKIVAPLALEVGTQGTVICSLDGLFPATEAQVHLALGDQRLSPTIAYGNDSISAKASVEVTAEEEGTHPLTCAVGLGNQSRSARHTATVYSFPEPNLTLSESEVSEGAEVTVECEAHTGALVTLNGVPARPLGPRAQFLLNARAEDNGRTFSCSAALTVAGLVLRKNQTRELRVLYGPRLDERDCPGNWSWEEGSQQTLRCQASGNPAPQLQCHRRGDGVLLPIGNVKRVDRNLAGTYLCRAVSARGEVTREVSVTVLYTDHHMAAIIPVAVLAILSTVGVTTYLYNRQRKIRKYRLQEAQKGTAMKLNAEATPP
ncbi:intercellular adhesion molecule 1 [Carlito syrichta]|uniref:Intercellular adhesion molecule 1 n=1 Tax=Carlito syrichta TaxID=1868482 RepID=A0A3Q0DZ39_CARSF|nr:intercellular adhesion molecule 1 [Carlito syrichta]